jgi:hypothetical protein
MLSGLSLMPDHSMCLNCVSPLPGTESASIFCWRQEAEISNVLYQRKAYEIY